jgi:hypothetical protein
MTKNVGKTDKIIRIIVGLLLILIYFINSNLIVGILGLLIIITGFTGVCWAYKIFGINTCAHELGNPAETKIQNIENPVTAKDEPTAQTSVAEDVIDTFSIETDFESQNKNNN